MIARARHHRSVRNGGAIALTLIVLGLAGTSANAAVPTVDSSWASAVFLSTARLSAKINPNGLATTYHFDYITESAYLANGETFAGASRIPPVTDTNIGSGTSYVSVVQLLSSLSSDTVYHYRLAATNASGTALGPDQFFITFPPAGSGTDPCANAAFRRDQSVGGLLSDCRAFEMVSPVDKNGGRVDPTGTLAAGGVLQAGAGGSAVTYSSAASFTAGAAGATSASQYIGSRTAGGWETQNITAPLFSGSYDTETGGAPYRLFSGDLARVLLLSGKRCRGDEVGCPVANPPLPGTDAPPGYQNYYLRDNGAASFEALLGAGDVAGLNVDPADFSLSLAGASPDLTHVALSSCSSLTPGAPDGCPSEANLYEWSAGIGLSLINVVPGAALAAQSGAVSASGSRVYWNEASSGNLYLHEGAVTKQVDADAGGGGTFQSASADGSIAFFTVAGHLWHYLDSSGHATDLTPSGGVAGVLGASAAGDYVYYQDGSGLQQWHNGTTTQVASGAADSSDYPPASGNSRVSADGTKLLFVATEPLIRSDGGKYDNTDLVTANPDSQVYLYDAAVGTLTCVSCNPSNERPLGASSIPGATHNGAGPDATIAYKPHALSADGRRVFFNSRDALVLTDTNSAPDTYEWEAQGEGSCTRAGGCVALISSGRAADGASFADASADGADAYFLTNESLVAGDPGSGDLYDARTGGGFAVPVKPIPCTGDSCQVLPPEPIDPTLTTLLPGPGNPPVRFPKHCRKGTIKRHGKCVGKHRKHGSHRQRSGR